MTRAPGRPQSGKRGVVRACLRTTRGTRSVCRRGAECAWGRERSASHPEPYRDAAADAAEQKLAQSRPALLPGDDEVGADGLGVEQVDRTAGLESADMPSRAGRRMRASIPASSIMRVSRMMCSNTCIASLPPRAAT